MTKEQIKELMEKANKHVGKMLDMASPEWKEHDLAIRHLQKALPDIAQTALDALQRVEVQSLRIKELEAYIEGAKEGMDAYIKARDTKSTSSKTP